MRKVLLPVLAIALLPASGVVRGDDEARAVIEKAVNAQGGLDILTQPRASHRKMTMVRHIGTSAVKYNTEGYSQTLQKMRIVYRQEGQPEVNSFTVVLNGDRGWRLQQGLTFDFGPEEIARYNRARHCDRVAGLTALLKDKGYKLASLADRQDKGKDLAGVRVSFEGQPDIDLFFDKETGLLFKTSQRRKDSPDQEEALHECYLTGYKLLDVVEPDTQLLQAAKLTTDGPALLQYLRKRTPAPEVRAQIQALIGKLSDPAYRVRTKATAELKKFGPAAGSLLRPALADPDREVVGRVQVCLEHIARNPETPLLSAALRLIALRRPPGAVPVLLNYLPWAADDMMADEVRAAVRAVAVRDGKPDPALTAALQSEDALLRQAAAIALGRGPRDRVEQAGRRVLVEGLRAATHIEFYRDGRLATELDLVHVEYFNRLDDSTFAHP